MSFQWMTVEVQNDTTIWKLKNGLCRSGIKLNSAFNVKLMATEMWTVVVFLQWTNNGYRDRMENYMHVKKIKGLELEATHADIEVMKS